jgi:hypothetical protein
MACEFIPSFDLWTALTGVFGRDNVPILSKDGEVFALLAGRPQDKTFVDDLKLLEKEMEIARDSLSFGKGTDQHRRGEYPTMSTGISYGGGSKVRGSLVRAQGELSSTFFRSSGPRGPSCWQQSEPKDP